LASAISEMGMEALEQTSPMMGVALGVGDDHLDLPPVGPGLLNGHEGAVACGFPKGLHITTQRHHDGYLKGLVRLTGTRRGGLLGHLATSQHGHDYQKQNPEDSKLSLHVVLLSETEMSEHLLPGCVPAMRWGTANPGASQISGAIARGSVWAVSSFVVEWSPP